MSDPRILFVSNLSAGLVDGAKLYKLFQNYGPIRQLRLSEHPSCKGCAIVVFDLCESAEAATQALHNSQLGKNKFLSVVVYNEAREKKLIDRRKRQRDNEVEYRQHLKAAGGTSEAEEATA